MWTEKMKKTIKASISLLLMVILVHSVAKHFEKKKDEPQGLKSHPTGETAKRDQEVPTSVPSDHVPQAPVMSPEPEHQAQVAPMIAPVTVPHADVIVHKDECYSVIYSHKKMASHSDGEACLKHKNLLILPPSVALENGKAINLDSVCIKVNNVPVRHSRVPGKKDRFLIGPEAGPDAKIVVNYCTGKKKCSEKCEIKRDEFMAALGVEDLENENQPGWDGTRGVSQAEVELEKHMSEISPEESDDHKLVKNVQKNSKKDSNLQSNAFSGWISDETLPWRCL